MAVGFAIQTVVGSVCFVVVLGAAAGIAWIVAALERWRFQPGWLSTGAQLVEKGIFYADVLVYGLLVLSEMLKFIRTLFREWNGHGEA